MKAVFRAQDSLTGADIVQTVNQAKNRSSLKASIHLELDKVNDYIVDRAMRDKKPGSGPVRYQVIINVIVAG